MSRTNTLTPVRGTPEFRRRAWVSLAGRSHGLPPGRRPPPARVTLRHTQAKRTCTKDLTHLNVPARPPPPQQPAAQASRALAPREGRQGTPEPAGAQTRGHCPVHTHPPTHADTPQPPPPPPQQRPSPAITPALRADRLGGRSTKGAGGRAGAARPTLPSPPPPPGPTPPPAPAPLRPLGGTGALTGGRARGAAAAAASPSGAPRRASPPHSERRHLPGGRWGRL